jgi:hypothetical protein
MTELRDLKPGYYWALWLVCDEGTKDFEIFEPREWYEPVEVTQNARAANHPQHLRVFVLGFDGSQDIRNFTFGERIEHAG